MNAIELPTLTRTHNATVSVCVCDLLFTFIWCPCVYVRSSGYFDRDTPIVLYKNMQECIGWHSYRFKLQNATLSCSILTIDCWNDYIDAATTDYYSSQAVKWTKCFIVNFIISIVCVCR